jgi:succinate dehydrogenase/fumarate reductase flavoprotein subunit
VVLREAVIYEEDPMEKYDVVVIGGSAAGIPAATAARKN